MPDCLGRLDHARWIHCRSWLEVQVSNSQSNLLDWLIVQIFKRIETWVPFLGIFLPLIKRWHILLVHHSLNFCDRLILILTCVIVWSELLRFGYGRLKLHLAVLPAALHGAQLHHLVLIIIMNIVVPSELSESLRSELLQDCLSVGLLGRRGLLYRTLRDEGLGWHWVILGGMMGLEEPEGRVHLR